MQARINTDLSKCLIKIDFWNTTKINNFKIKRHCTKLFGYTTAKIVNFTK